MTTAGKVQQKDPVERQMDTTAWVIWIAIIIPLIGYAAYTNGTDASDEQPGSQMIQVCPNVQPQLDQSYWTLYASWPPNTGIYKVTYSASKDGTNDVDGIERVSSDISTCP